MATELDNPFSYFTDRRGDALDQGYVYIGEANKDPELFPIDLFWDEAMTVPAVQPLRTVAGYVVNPGAGNSPGNIYFAEAEYSIRIRDRNAVQVFYVAAAEDRLSAFISQLAGPNGSSLVGFSQNGAGAATRTVQDKLREAPASILDYRQPGDTTDTAAWVRALAAGQRRVYFPAGQGLGTSPAGCYLLDTQSTVAGNPGKQGYLPDGIEVFGDGMEQTIIRPADPGQTIFRAFGDGPNDPVNDIWIHDLTLHGYSVESLFSEHVHLLALCRVRRALIERVGFKAARGDSLILSYGETFGEEGHNYDSTIRDCWFDGVNHQNRNAISIIDGDGILVENCVIENHTHPSMPGPLDIEPDSAPHYVGRSITFRNIVLRNNGGNLGEVTAFYPSTVPVPYGLRWEDISSTGYIGTGAMYCVSMNRAMAAADMSLAISIAGTAAKTGNSPFFFYSGKGITLDETNVFDTFDNTAIAGGGGASDLLWDSIIRPTLRNCGTGVASGILTGKAINVEYGGCWYQCGQNAVGGHPIQFTSGTSSQIAIRGLTITKGSNQVIAISNDGHTFTPATNTQENNYLDGLTSQFEATASGQILIGSVVFNPPSIGPGVGATAAVTVAGAELGDYVTASFSNSLQGIQLSADVSATNTATAIFYNGTGGAIDLASGTVRARVVKA